jgi:DNA polymerase (family X)
MSTQVSQSTADMPTMSNAEIADRLASVAQLLSTQKENPYKVKAYQRAAANIRHFSESIDALVREESDLTAYAGIGQAIASAIREIVLTGTLGKLETLRSQASPELSGISAYPRLDPKRILRIDKKLGISSTDELREKLESGEIEQLLGLRMAQHVRQGLTEAQAILLYKAHELRDAVEEFLLDARGVRRVEAVGDYRRRVKVIEELAFIVETADFPSLVARLKRYGGRTPLLKSTQNSAVCALPGGCRRSGKLGAFTGAMYGQQSTSAKACSRYGKHGGPEDKRSVPNRRGALRELRAVVHRTRTARGLR